MIALFMGFLDLFVQILLSKIMTEDILVGLLISGMLPNSNISSVNISVGQGQVS